MEKNAFPFVMIAISVLFALDAPSVGAQSQPCLDFRGFPATTSALSPVVAPPGEVIPSDIHIKYWDNLVPEYYSFYKSTVTNLQGNPEVMTALYSDYYGEIIITFDNPVNSGLMTFTLMHFNQPEIELRLFDSNNQEITNGWEATNWYPNFDPWNPDPETNTEYSQAVSTYFDPATPIKQIWVRNLSGKNALFGFCVY